MSTPVAIITVALLCGVSLFYVLLSRSLKKREAERMQGEEPEAASAE